MLKRILASEQIFVAHFLILANIRLKILVLKQSFAKLQANFLFNQIFACKYLHKSEDLLANICILVNIR
jgi:hypothetical protein